MPATRTETAVAAVILAASVIVAVASAATAAPTRLEAETATISQGVVESNHAGYSGTGFVNLDNVAGSYLEVAVTGPVSAIVIRYANGTTGNRPMAVNGSTVDFPGTGAWTTWATATVPLALPAGTHAVRLTSAAAEGGPNLDYIEFETVTSPPAGEQQAEDATISQGLVEFNHAGFTGTGFVNVDNVVGSYVQFSVTAAAGSSSLNVRYANGTTASRPMSVTVNGSPAGSLAFAPTGAWTTWITASVTATLPAGANTIRLTSTSDTGGPNLDRLNVTAGAPPGTVVVSSISQLQSAINAANPGARIVLTNGIYTTTSAISVNRSGSAAAPIVIAAQNVGGAEIRGSAGFSFGAVSYVAVEGFRLMHNGSLTIPGGAHHIRLSRNVVQMTGTNWVTVIGNDCEVSYNTFQNKSTQGVFLQIAGAGAADMAQRTWIHHNYFSNHTFSGANGGESIRLGYSYRQLASANSIVEYNLFERANGDPEAISVKSSDNVIRYNTLRNSTGWIVLRHGNRNRVEGNIGLGSGIRFYENDHVIVNNLVLNSYVIAGSGTIIDDTGASTAHARPDRVTFAFNTLTGSGRLLEIGSGGETYGPDNCTFANNIFSGSGAAVVDVVKGSNLHWQGNIVWNGTGGDMPAAGYRAVNPGLVTDSGGLPRLGSASRPAVDTAAGSYPQVPLDLDLGTRIGAKDVGADEFGAGAQRRALTTAEVGPNAA